jgi:multidrug resistance efflux pump
VAGRKGVVAITEELLKEIREDLRRVSATQTHILTVQERQQASLEEHIRRTEAAEAGLETVRAELAPLKVHAAVWGAAAKALAAVGTLVSIGIGVMKLWEAFGG